MAGRLFIALPLLVVVSLLGGAGWVGLLLASGVGWWDHPELWWGAAPIWAAACGALFARRGMLVAVAVAGTAALAAAIGGFAAFVTYLEIYGTGD